MSHENNNDSIIDEVIDDFSDMELDELDADNNNFNNNNDDFNFENFDNFDNEEEPVQSEISKQNEKIDLKANKKKLKEERERQKREVKAAKEAKAAKNSKKADKKKFAIIALIAVALIAICLNLFKGGTVNSNLHVKLADNTPKKETKTENSESTAKNNVGDSTESDKDSSENVLNISDSYSIPMVINTKTENDSAYTDHKTNININYNDVVIGFDDVQKYVDEYNNKNSSKISLGKKKDFNSKSEYNIVMYRLALEVPKDFPTNDVKHGYTGLSPKIDFSIKGGKIEDTLIVDNTAYDIPDITSMSDSVSNITVGNTYELNYIVAMPRGLSSKDYKITFDYSDGKVSKTIQLQTADIKKK